MNPLIVLHELLAERFSEDEFRTLCFGLGVRYENLGGEGLAGKARELITLMERTDHLPDLLAAARRARPTAPWPTLDADPAPDAPTAPPEPPTPPPTHVAQSATDGGKIERSGITAKRGVTATQDAHGDGSAITDSPIRIE